MPTGYLLIAHGSKNSIVRDEVASLAGEISRKMKSAPVEYAFLELQDPSIEVGFTKLVSEHHCEKIIILMHFLNSGKHVLSDIPNHIQILKEKFPKIEVSLSSPIGSHASLVDLYAEIARSCQS